MDLPGRPDGGHSSHKTQIAIASKTIISKTQRQYATLKIGYDAIQY
jgi:hypothetical protein